MNKNFSSDKPVINETEDRFQRYSFSKRIAHSIIQRANQDGIVIGIYGAWGEGKTSVQNFIENELLKDNTILIVKLNPWRYNDEDTLIRNYLKKIGTVLGKELETRKEKFGDFISKYGSVGEFFGINLTELGKSLADVDLEELKNRIDDFLKESTKKLVIFVDDIDRLDKQEIYSLFRLVKLTGDFTNTTYILSFDEHMVAAAIGERFGSGSELSGQSFLEKIIQVPLKIPQAQVEALKKYSFELVDKAINESEIELTKDEAQIYVSQFSENVLLRLKTPRLAIRYGNSLSFAMPLLKDEVNHVDLMLIESIKIFYPRHYEFIKSNPNYFLSSYSSTSYFGNQQDIKSKKDELSEHLEKLSSELTRREKSSIFYLLSYLFPRLNEAFNNTFIENGERKWYKEKRIASTGYFKRYFSYSVIKGELSDVVFDEFIKSISANELHDITNNIEELIKESSADTFIMKIRNYEEELDWELIKKLAVAIAIVGVKFPKGGSIFSFGMDGAQGQACSFIYNAIKRHSNIEEGFELGKILMAEPIHFEFSYLINNWLRTGRTGDEKLFTIEQYVELAKILKERTLKNSGEIPIFEKYPDHTVFIFGTWKEFDEPSLNQYIKNILDKNPEKVKELLIAYTPTEVSSNRAEPYKTNFTQEQYSYFITILDKDFVHNSIDKSFKNEIQLKEVQFVDFDDHQTDLNILRQFEYWYTKDIENKVVE